MADPGEHASAPAAADLIVELNPRLTGGDQHAAAFVERMRSYQIITGAAVLVLIVVVIIGGGLATGATRRGDLWLIPVLASGVLLFWFGLRTLRRPRWPMPDYAFKVTSDTIEYPPGPGRQPAESWQLKNTTTYTGRWLGLRALTLKCDGFATRRYHQFVLQLPVRQVADLIRQQASR